MLRRVVVLTHGLNTGIEDGRWLDTAKAYLDAESRRLGLSDEIEVLVHRWDAFAWGYFTPLGRFLAAAVPVASPRWRNRQVRAFQAFLAWIRKEYGTSVEIDVAAHSFGCYKAHQAMLLESDQPRAFYRRLVYFAGAVSSRFKPEEAAGHFQKIVSYHSKEDDVIALSPIGNAGYAGFAFADGKAIVNVDVTPHNHNDYWRPQHMLTHLKAMGEIFFSD